MSRESKVSKTRKPRSDKGKKRGSYNPVNRVLKKATEVPITAGDLHSNLHDAAKEMNK